MVKRKVFGKLSVSATLRMQNRLYRFSEMTMSAFQTISCRMPASVVFSVLKYLVDSVRFSPSILNR